MKENIYKVVIFFDVFDFAPTAFEVWRFLDSKFNLLEVIDFLDNNLHQEKSFYFLPGRKILVQKRFEKYKATAEKIKIAKKINLFFQFIPFIQKIYIANSIGGRNLREEGDIDLFIVTQKNRAWIVRFCCVLITKILKIRPEKNNIKNKICLSFFVDENNFDFNQFAFKNIPEDLYLKFWQKSLIKITERNLKNNRNIFLDKLNYLFFKIQDKFLPKEIQVLKNLDTRVVVNSGVLKFHTQDNREYFYNQFQERLRKYEASI